MPNSRRAFRPVGHITRRDILYCWMRQKRMQVPSNHVWPRVRGFSATGVCAFTQSSRGRGKMRIRTVKPEFWMHEGLCKCSEFSRLLAVALLNWSDDEGYFMANPILIRGQVFPFEEDSKKVPRGLQELSGAGWIRLGKDDQGRSVGMVINFAKHQRVDKPKASSIKASSAFQDPSKTCRA